MCIRDSVDHDGDRLLAAQPLEQLFDGQGLRHQERRNGDPAHRGPQPVLGGDGQRVLEVDHADDLVDAVPVDGKAGQAGGPREVEDVRRGRRRLQGADLHPRGHDVLRGESGEGQGPHEEIGGVLLQGAGLGGVPGQGDEFTGRPGGGEFGGGFDTQEPHQPVGHGVQCGDHRSEEGGEAVLGPGDETGDLERPGDRPVLRHQLADHHLHGGGEEHADHDAHPENGP